MKDTYLFQNVFKRFIDTHNVFTMKYSNMKTFVVCIHMDKVYKSVHFKVGAKYELYKTQAHLIRIIKVIKRFLFY